MFFSVVLPGRLPINGEAIKQTSETQWMIQIPDFHPNEHQKTVTIFLNTPMPSGVGAAVYIADKKQQFKYAGCLLNEKPSETMKIPHFDVPATGDANYTNPATSPTTPTESNTLVIGVSLEKLDVLQNLEITRQQERLHQKSNKIYQLATYICKDLYVFMESFAKPTNMPTQPDVLVVPTNVLERWVQKFHNKVSRDPHFWKKQQI